MPDINLRMDRDVVVLSAPLESTVASMGIANGDFELALLVENDTIEEAYRRALIAGASCLVTPTGGLTRARLARRRLENRAADLVKAAFEPLSALREQAMRPQHVLAEIGPCGLPLDVSSPASVSEHRNEYAALIALLEAESFDGFLLDGFRRWGEVQPALDAIRERFPQEGVAIFVSFEVFPDGRLAAGFEDLGDVAEYADEYGISALGLRAFEREHADDGRAIDGFDAKSEAMVRQRELLATTVDLAHDAACQTSLPLLVEIPIVENEADLDDLIETAELLHQAGVQFVRATGPDATSLHTAAIAGAVGGMPVVGRSDHDDGIVALITNETPGDARDDGIETGVDTGSSVESSDDDIPFTPIPDDLIARFSARVDEALRRAK